MSIHLFKQVIPKRTTDNYLNNHCIILMERRERGAAEAIRSFRCGAWWSVLLTYIYRKSLNELRRTDDIHKHIPKHSEV